MIARFPTVHVLVVVSVVVILASLLPAPICSAEEYHSSSYGYRLDVPEGWVEIPRDIVQEMVAVLQKQNAAAIIIYDAAFQLEAADQWFEYPYVLVQPLPYAGFGLHRP